MRRRTYLPDSKGEKIRQAILEQMRVTRAALDPALLERGRRAVRQHAEDGKVFWEEKVVDGKVFFDRRKTLSVVLKFLELKPDSTDIRRQIKAMLADTIH